MRFIIRFWSMVQGSFVLSAYRKKGDDQIQKINKRQTNLRYIVVVIAILVVFGCQYCFDTASALQINIEQNMHDAGTPLSEAEFNLLYALYAFPNIVIPLIGGIVIDKYGARIALMISAMFCVLGQIIFGLGGYDNAFTVMLIGRIVFGLGGEVLHASQNTLISNWFKASELSMILGICLSFPKMGSSLNSYVTPKLASSFASDGHYMNVAGPIFVGSLLMSVSLVLAVILVLSYIDRKTEKTKGSLLTDFVSESQFKAKQIKRSNHGEEVKTIMASEINPDAKAEAEGGQHLNLKQIANLPAAFWLILIISMLAEALFIPFLDNGNAYYTAVFGISTEDAGVYLILPYCVSSLFVVVLGFIVDRVEKRSYALIASCFFFMFTYLFMMFTESTEAMRNSEFVRWLPSFLLGICIAIFCAIIVPTVPMLIKPQLLGTGFGIMEMLQNLALGVFPLVGGALRETKGENRAEGFHLQTLFFFLISCLCVGMSFILKGIDMASGRKLDEKDFRKQYIHKILKEQSVKQ